MKLPLTLCGSKILTFQESINESKNGKSEEQTRSKCIEMMALESHLCPQSLTSLLSVPTSWDIKQHENIEYMRREVAEPTKYRSVYLFHFSCHVPDNVIIRGECTISDLNNITSWHERWFGMRFKRRTFSTIYCFCTGIFRNDNVSPNIYVY